MQPNRPAMNTNKQQTGWQLAWCNAETIHTTQTMHTSRELGLLGYIRIELLPQGIDLLSLYLQNQNGENKIELLVVGHRN